MKRQDYQGNKDVKKEEREDDHKENKEQRHLYLVVENGPSVKISAVNSVKHHAMKNKNKIKHSDWYDEFVFEMEDATACYLRNKLLDPALKIA